MDLKICQQTERMIGFDFLSRFRERLCDNKKIQKKIADGSEDLSADRTDDRL